MLDVLVTSDPLFLYLFQREDLACDLVLDQSHLAERACSKHVLHLEVGELVQLRCRSILFLLLSLRFLL